MLCTRVADWPTCSWRLHLLCSLLQQCKGTQADNVWIQTKQCHEDNTSQLHRLTKQQVLHNSPLYLSIPEQQQYSQCDRRTLQQLPLQHLAACEHACCGNISAQLSAEHLHNLARTAPLLPICSRGLFASAQARCYITSTASIKEVTYSLQQQTQKRWPVNRSNQSLPLASTPTIPDTISRLRHDHVSGKSIHRTFKQRPHQQQQQSNKQRSRRQQRGTEATLQAADQQQQKQQGQQQLKAQQSRRQQPGTEATLQAADQKQQQQQQQQTPGFSDIGVSQELVQILQTGLGVHHPTPVQVESMKPVMEGRNVAIQSATGTGKTLAYLLPLMAKLKPWELGASNVRQGRVLVLTPTQELCMQVVRTARSLCPTDRQSVMPLVGGSNFLKAVKNLTKHKPWLVVATPGRLKDIADKPNLFKKVFPHLTTGQHQDDCRHPRMTLVLEEAPKLLSMSDTQLVLDRLAPQTRQTAEITSVMGRLLQQHQLLLVSANLKAGALSAAPAWAQANPVMITAPPPSSTAILAQRNTPNTQPPTADLQTYLTEDSIQPVSEDKPRTQLLPDNITHQVMVFDPKKPNLERLVLRCLRWYQGQGHKVLLFMGDQGKLVKLAERLTAGPENVKVHCLHGRLPAQTKTTYIRQFNQGRCDALLVSDGFALGLDFECVDVVMQVGSLPASLSQYINRAGRCGRMGRPGKVLSIIPEDRRDPFERLLRRANITPVEMIFQTRLGRKGPALTLKPVKLVA